MLLTFRLRISYIYWRKKYRGEIYFIVGQLKTRNVGKLVLKFRHL